MGLFPIPFRFGPQLVTLQLASSVRKNLVLVRFIMVIAGSGPHQISPPYVESANVHQQGELHNLEQGNHVDNQQEGSSQTLHAGGSDYRRKSHLVYE